MRPTLETGLCDKKISFDKNQFLIYAFSVAKIKEALESCDSSKSPGPDGFNFRFLKEY